MLLVNMKLDKTVYERSLILHERHDSRYARCHAMILSIDSAAQNAQNST